MKIHIKKGRLIDPKNNVDGVTDIYLAAGKVAGIGQAPEGFNANREIDASNLIVAPGLIDLAARLREPGYEYLATLESEMQAAVAGGVTRLVCPPDTDPVLDEPGLVEMLKHRAKSLNQAHVYPLGALTQGLAGKVLTEMAELHDAGCIGFSQAAAPIVRRSLRSGMIALVDSTKTTGLIFFPGTMVGMLLAGAEPTDAVRLQLILLWVLLGSVAISSLVATTLAYRGFFTAAEQLREPPDP